MTPHFPVLVRRYSAAIASTACAVCGRILLQSVLEDECPFTLFYLSVLLTAWIAGTGPAILAIALGTLSAAHFFVSPASSLKIDDPDDLLQLLMYIFVNGVAIVLFHRIERQRRIAERKSAENETLTRSLKEADERKDEFLALLAHELRNPLAPIRSSLELLDRNPMSADVLPRVRDVIRRQTNHLVRLTDDLLDVARFCRGQTDLQICRMDVRTAVEDGVEMTASMFSEKGHRFQLLLPDEPVWVKGDRVRIAQLTANLLGNASKYTPSGGRVSLQMEQIEDSVFIIISDNGVGFSACEAERILEPFVQIDASRTREYGGLGLGLTIVKRLVELHGGRLRVESRGPGMGSCFTVELKTVAPVPEICRTGNAGNAEPDEQRFESTESRRVLIVEDSSDSGEILCELLESEGFSTRLAEDGLTALQEFSDFSPDVVVLDIGLPGMDGYEVARRIRRLGSGSGTSLIALTGWGGSADRELSAQAGFDEHLVKPVIFGELLRSIERVSGNGRSGKLTGCRVSDQVNVDW